MLPSLPEFFQCRNPPRERGLAVVNAAAGVEAQDFDGVLCVGHIKNTFNHGWTRMNTDKKRLEENRTDNHG
jgi:hypothetical protein